MITYTYLSCAPLMCGPQVSTQLISFGMTLGSSSLSEAAVPNRTTSTALLLFLLHHQDTDERQPKRVAAECIAVDGQHGLSEPTSFEWFETTADAPAR